MNRRLGLTMLAALAAAMPTAADALPFERLRLSDYSAFVANWPGGGAFCTVIRSMEQWNAVVRPAPAMGRPAPTMPPADYFEEHAVLLFARSAAGGGDSEQVLRILSVEQNDDRIDVAISFTAPVTTATYTNKYAALAAIDLPLEAGSVAFTEDGEEVCTASATATGG